MTAADNASTGHLHRLWVGTSFSGADTRAFLQSQLTCDVSMLGSERSMMGAYLSPKGRVLGLLLLVAQGEDVLAFMHPNLRDTLINRLRMFVLRSKVRIEPADATVTGVIRPASAAEQPLDWSRLATHHAGAAIDIQWAPGRELRIDAPEAADSDLADAWLSADCRDGLPLVTEASSDQHVAQMLNLDRLQAVSFRKGCYPGQEIVARAHYRGQVKRRLHRYLAGAPLPPGAKLLDEAGSGVGEVLISGPCEAGDGFPLLAVVRDDRAAETLHAEPPAQGVVRPQVDRPEPG